MKDIGDDLRRGSRILGLDPGLRITGYAVIEVAASGPELIEAGVIRSGKERLEKRLSNLYHDLVKIIEQYQPDTVVVEQLFAHYKHPRTAIIMGHARGVLLLAAGQKNLVTRSYAAQRIKKTICGHGRATKQQIQETIRQELGLAQVPEPPDVADAIAVALCHYYCQVSRTHDIA